LRQGSKEVGASSACRDFCKQLKGAGASRRNHDFNATGIEVNPTGRDTDRRMGSNAGAGQSFVCDPCPRDIQSKAGLMKRVPLNTLHVEDRKSFEKLFSSQGSPSCGVDVVIRKKGVRLSEGGAVLELNIPCGVGYLEDLPQVVRRELRQWVSQMKGFIQRKGRVPVWVVSVNESKVYRKQVERRFFKRYPKGQLAKLGSAGWLPILSSTDARAFLVEMEPDALLEFGMPRNLLPRCYTTKSEVDLAQHDPILSATIKNAGGRLIR
jgi:hypothetical protein